MYNLWSCPLRSNACQCQIWSGIALALHLFVAFQHNFKLYIINVLLNYSKRSENIVLLSEISIYKTISFTAKILSSFSKRCNNSRLYFNHKFLFKYITVSQEKDQTLISNTIRKYSQNNQFFNSESSQELYKSCDSCDERQRNSALINKTTVQLMVSTDSSIRSLVFNANNSDLSLHSILSYLRI